MAGPDEKSPIAYQETTPIGDANAAAGGPLRLQTDDRVAGRYRIVRHLASGGMGDVFEAEDLELKERVALKTVRADLITQAALLERFKREIQLARKVTHPNVCRIYEFGLHGDLAFLTMELLHGETLAQRIRRDERLSPSEAAPIVAQVAAALDAAHGAGVIHRDFKSGNVILARTRQGELRAVVTDFGLACADTAFRGADVASSAFVGTPSYMAPEQVEGGEISPATDVYALGVVLFEMVSGHLPFRGESPLQTAVKRITEAPPRPRSIVPDLPPRWERAILRCLERDPARRFAHAGEVPAALRGEPVRTRSSAPRRAMLAAVAAVLLAVVATLASRIGPRAADLGGLPLPMPHDRAAARAFADGVRAFWEGDERRAREQLEAAATRAPSEAAVTHALLAHLQRRLGDQVAWQREAQLAVAQTANLDDDERLLVEATVREAAHDRRAAVDAYRGLVRRHPSSLAAGLLLAAAQAGESSADADATLQRLRALPPPLRDDPHLGLARIGLGLSFAEQADIAERAAAESSRRHLPLLRAEALNEQAWALGILGDLARSVALASESKELYADTQQPAVLRPLNTISVAQFLRGEHQAAARVLEETIAIARTNGGARGVAVALLDAAINNAFRGHFDEADRQLAEGSARADEFGGDYLRALRLLSAGWVAQIRGRLNDAEQSYERAMSLTREGNESQHLFAWALHNHGELRLARGDVVGARARLQEAADVRARLGQQALLRLTRLGLGEVDLAEGRAAQAEATARTLAEELLREGARDQEALARLLLARALEAQGRRDEARGAVDAALGRLRASENPRVRHAIVLVDAELRARGDASTAEASLARVEEARAEADRLRIRGDVLEAQRVAALLQIAAGRERAGRAALAALAEQARADGFGRIAERAAHPR